MRLLQDAADAADGVQTSILTDVLLPVVLGLIMLGMGLGLRTRHFGLLLTEPRGVTAGLLGQLLLLPIAGTLVALVAVRFFGLETELALGLLLLAAVPGGATSNMLTWLSRGDTALSVALTAFTSIGSVLLTPLVFFITSAVVFSDGALIRVAPLDVLKLTLAVVAGPVLLGMYIGHRNPRIAARFDRPLRIFSLVVFAVLVAGIIFQNRAGFWGFAAATVPAALALNVLALGAGFLVARTFRLGDAQTRSAVIEVGFQNGTFAILLAVSQLDSARAALIPGFYSLLMYATGGLLALYWTRRGAPAPVARRPIPAPTTTGTTDARPARRPLTRGDI